MRLTLRRASMQRLLSAMIAYSGWRAGGLARKASLMLRQQNALSGLSAGCSRATSLPVTLSWLNKIATGESQPKRFCRNRENELFRGSRGQAAMPVPAHLRLSTYSFSNSRNRLVCTRLTGISECFLSSMRNW